MATLPERIPGGEVMVYPLVPTDQQLVYKFTPSHRAGAEPPTLEVNCQKGKPKSMRARQQREQR